MKRNKRKEKGEQNSKKLKKLKQKFKKKNVCLSFLFVSCVFLFLPLFKKIKSQKTPSLSLSLSLSLLPTKHKKMAEENSENENLFDAVEKGDKELVKVLLRSQNVLLNFKFRNKVFFSFSFSFSFFSFHFSFFIFLFFFLFFSSAKYFLSPFICCCFSEWLLLMW